jgi:outer membrane protein TolC
LFALWFLLATSYGLAAGADETASGDFGPAASAAPAPSLDQLVATALERSPSLAALRAKAAAAHEQAAPAGGFNDPMLEATGQESFMDPAAPKTSKATLELSQQFPFPGKRGARRDAVDADAKRQAAEIRLAERRLIADVRAVYGKLYAVDREQQYLIAGEELMRLLAAAASARYQVGQGEQEALLKAQLAVSRLSERRTTLAAERAALVADLNRLLDQPGDQPLGAVGALPEVAAPPPANIPPENAAQTAVKRAGVAAAELKLEAARQEVYPDFLVGLGGGYELNQVNNQPMPMAMLRIGITLPIWQSSKQRPLIRAAEYERETARQEERDALATVRAAETRLRAEWDRDERLITLYREGIVPQSQAALEAARASYLTGRGDFSTVVEDFNLWLESRVELARREADRLGVWAELEALRTVADNQSPSP